MQNLLAVREKAYEDLVTAAAAPYSVSPASARRANEPDKSVQSQQQQSSGGGLFGSVVGSLFGSK